MYTYTFYLRDCLIYLVLFDLDTLQKLMIGEYREYQQTFVRQGRVIAWRVPVAVEDHVALANLVEEVCATERESQSS